ncbi:MAG: rhamnogalacturonan endolyase family protein, partial [Planctomycetota bacterium]
MEVRIMRSRFWFIWMIGLLVLFSCISAVSGIEKLDRGLVAVEREDGSVYLSWRLL